MLFKISKNNTQKHIFDFEFKFKPKSKIVELQFPAWRPGRYEIQNFSKNIQTLRVFSQNNESLFFRKVTKDKWEILANNEEVTVKYSYYANKKDAGNSFVDDEVFYLNFVNCIPFIIGEIDEAVVVNLDIPIDWQIACALTTHKNKLKAKSFYELYDSPLIASKKVNTEKYKIKNIKFTIQIIGNYNPNWEKILPLFKAFCRQQILQMGSFPATNYDFIIWVLPTAFYHGVEHSKSTMIVVGPDIEGDGLISDILGVCSHELFHAWNICKIRPTQLLPYDYTKENYFDTGFIVEGVTTYFGDLFLLQSDVISKNEYLKELSTLCIRHFTDDGSAYQSLTESSIDLWVDGYQTGIPNKKVSIYNKGALVALLLDLMIRNKFDHKRSLYTLMRDMWEKFGKFEIGYDLLDYKKLAENIYDASLDSYFEMFIYGNTPLEQALNNELVAIGLEINWKNENTIAVSEIKNQSKVQKNNFKKFKSDKLVTI